MLAKTLRVVFFATLSWYCASGNYTQNNTSSMNESEPDDFWNPIECQGENISCEKDGFDADGFPTFEQYCVSPNSSGESPLSIVFVEDDNDTDFNASDYDYVYDDEFYYDYYYDYYDYDYDYDYDMGPQCPMACGENAKMCGSGDEGFCVHKDEDCPIVCGEAKPLMCFVDDFDDSGEFVDYKEVCVADNETCPCGAKAKSCNATDLSYCVPEAESCPVTCTENQRECFPVSFTAEGELDDSDISVSCVASDASCSCGTNAILCKETDPEFGTFEWCEPAEIDGVANSCPVQCNDDQQVCVDLVFDSDGEVIDFKEQCVAADQSCPCGAESNKCVDEMGEYCLPKSFGSCPVECTDGEEYCFVDSFDAFGEWTGTQESCVKKGATCNCATGTNAKSCTFSDPFNSESWTECIFKDEYCPVTCSAGQVQCPEVEEFDSMGEFVKAVTPKKPCVAKLSDCACGKGAQQCKQGDFSWCQPKVLGCPIACKKDFQECYLDNFNATGHFQFSQGKCVDERDPCPCGKNAKKCADGMCIPKTEACDCKASERACSIADFAKDGSVKGFTSVCVAKNAACPCGQNSKRCKGETAADNYCLPKGSKDGKGGECHQYCKPEELASGKVNCVQTNLDKSGDFVSQVVKCVVDGKCTPGRNMKKCPSGAVISVKEECKTLYLVTDNADNSTKKGRSEDQEATIKFAIDSTKSDAEAAAAAASMMIAMNSVLQTPPDLVTTLTVKAPKKTARRLQASKKTFTYTIKNTGKIIVSPQQVAAQAKTMMKKGSPQMKKATKSIGTVSAGSVYTSFKSKKSAKANRSAMRNSESPTAAPTVAPTVADAPTESPAPTTLEPTAAPTNVTTYEEEDEARMGARPVAVLFLLAVACAWN
eukprot:TRINITY_DN23614_c0_g1_i1.p1 TRINITY_DN23614_c0_g1~~TRINITY_DN23614_c0_g1_i1.p1  ORF type:complete len:880 (-),score=157.13 TRINITY_DN23614_c0_g1_i1:49-2688(-)